MAASTLSTRVAGKQESFMSIDVVLPEAAV
jgi:hypothetical protein